MLHQSVQQKGDYHNKTCKQLIEEKMEENKERLKKQQKVRAGIQLARERNRKEKAAKEEATPAADGAKTGTAGKKEELTNRNKEEDGKGDQVPPEEVKKPRYFPPKKLPNPFESAAQEQEKFLQARKEALAKYSELSKNRFKQDEN